MCANQQIHKMEGPGVKAEQVVLAHVEEHLKRPVVIVDGGMKIRPHIGRKQSRNVLVARDKRVALQLKRIVGYKAVPERIRVQSQAHDSQNQEVQACSAVRLPVWETSGARRSRPF